MYNQGKVIKYFLIITCLDKLIEHMRKLETEIRIEMAHILLHMNGFLHTGKLSLLISIVCLKQAII